MTQPSGVVALTRRDIVRFSEENPQNAGLTVEKLSR